MKVHEIIGEQQLDEVNLRHAAAATLAGAALMGMPHKAITPSTPQPKAVQQPNLEPIEVDAKYELDAKTQALVDAISKRYDADPNFVQEVVTLARKYQKPGFPTARELLAVIAVESSFDPNAVSGLSHDPAVGLMQIRPKVWGVDPQDLKDPATNIKMGSDILHKYYRHLHHNKAAAIQAYNVGLTDYKQGVDNQEYLMKVANHLRNIRL